MTKLVCSTCKHELWTLTPWIWYNEIHTGCGGKYYDNIIYKCNSCFSEFNNGINHRCPFCDSRLVYKIKGNSYE